MPVMDSAFSEEAAKLATRRARVARQLDLMLETRGPVEIVRRLVADLDSVSADLAKALSGKDPRAPREPA